MEVNWDPVLIQIGPLAIRWYGFFMAVSMAAGLYVWCGTVSGGATTRSSSTTPAR